MVLTQAPPHDVCPVGQRHVLVWQVWPPVQATPQPPQLAPSVARLTQRPLHTVWPVGHAQRPPVQKPPVAHTVPQPPQLDASPAVTTQRPPHSVCAGRHAHAPTAHTWPVAHALLQRPQCAVLIAVTTQRPLQNVCPNGHAHAPPMQLWPPPQALLQRPQWAPSLRVLTQLAPQSVKPVVQLQTPPAHTCPAGQRLLQPPQWKASVFGSTQAVHITRGAVQVETQTPSTQPCPAEQPRLHAPQCEGLLRVLTSQPSASWPLQSARPALHVSAHDAATQSAALSGRAGHTRPHAPQLVAAVSDASQPLLGSPSQSPKPAAHRSTQLPISQAAVAIAPAGHTRLHTPQCWTSVAVFTQRPPQIASPGAQSASFAGASSSTSGGGGSVGTSTAVASGATSSTGSVVTSRPLSVEASAGTSSSGRSSAVSGASATSSGAPANGWLSAQAAHSSAPTSHRNDRIMTPPSRNKLAPRWKHDRGVGRKGRRPMGTESPWARRPAARRFVDICGAKFFTSRMRFDRIAPLALTAALAAPLTASAQVRQPDGTVVPLRNSSDGLSVGEVLGRRGEMNLRAPFTPYDAQANARQDPQTFRPGCRISFTVIARFAGHADAFGWYNVVPGRTTPPPVAERYVIVPAGNMDTPMAMGGVGFTANLDIGTDARYRGGDIGFFLENTTQEHVYFTERRYQPRDVPGFVYGLIYDSRVTAGGFYFAWEDLIQGNDSDFNDLIVLVDNLTCTGGGAACAVPGARGVCATGVLQCRNAELTCVSTTQPSAERCDGFDNNCDGTVDEGDTLCPARQVCDRGVCVERCQVELGCLPGFVCTPRGSCVETACATTTCAAGTVCTGGRCVAACDGVTCPRAQVCRQGRCVDPCAGLTCDRDQVCVEGVCQTRCPCRRCGASEQCMTDGRCRSMDCATVTCGAGQYCQGGRCLDACQGAVCPRGGRCVAGACVEPVTLADAGADSGSDGGRDAAADALPPVDAPFFQDVSVAMDDGPREPTPIAGSESGCGCRTTTTGDGRGVGLALLAAAAALSGRRRRR